MATFAGRRDWIGWLRRGKPATVPVDAGAQATIPAPATDFDIAPNDPLLSYLTSVASAVDIDSLQLDSPAVAELRAAGVKLLVPLVSRGELIGMLNLGPRLSEQEFSSDDRRLLNNLAAQAAPAVRVAQLIQEQQIEARERERIAQELRVAQLIQQQFLPRQLPDLRGWQLAAHYQPAREVGGDFYDFIDLPSGERGVVVGDVTDKGVPAALVMASTRSILRTEALRTNSPGEVLQRVNDLLRPDIPDRMFVTCLYAVLDPRTGRLRYANAGHNLPYLRSGGAVHELRATGMPLGLFPGMTYEEREATVAAGDRLLLYSDGLVEAHNEQAEMFGFARVMGLFGSTLEHRDVIDVLLTELQRFTGPGHEQEDDITLVTLVRGSEASVNHPDAGGASDVLVSFELPSEPGNERQAMTRVIDAVAPLSLGQDAMERLRTAVSEGVMNAIEHGNGNNPELPVGVTAAVEGSNLVVRIVDRGSAIVPEAPQPDLDLKLVGLQGPRGWGLFLIRNMVDDMRQFVGDGSHTVELVLSLPEGGDDNGRRTV
jgi:serine phosphatase RsbU (regulator of sigma subunit)/anti-sigma regulatory factor (Ser/Thr protein kinase)